jgi:glycosyltransferase involved in cell wall biosynthesis
MQNRIRKIKNKPKTVWLHCSFKVITRDIKTDCSVYDKVICISDKLRTDMEEYCPKLKDRFEKIYIPFDIEKIRRIAEKKDVLSIEEQKLLADDYFVAATRLSTDKDLDTLISAYKMFFDETFSQTKLYLIGDGADRKRLEEKVRGDGLSEMVLFLGQKNEPYPFIKNSKASILSSREEGAPLVIVEGMILQTIVVSSDCPTSPRELLNDGKCGVLFEPGNVNELKNIMIKIDRDQITKKQFSENSEERIRAFDVNNVIHQIEKIIMC